MFASVVVSSWLRSCIMALGDRLREVVAVLGDPGAVSRVGRKGGTIVFNFRPAFSPDPTDCTGSPRMGGCLYEMRIELTVGLFWEEVCFLNTF